MPNIFVLPWPQKIKRRKLHKRPDIEKARGNMRRREKNDGKGGRLALYAMARARVAQRAVKVGR